jgi:hypothetical protein
VGCLLGIKNGLAGIQAGKDWRTPLADRIFLVSAEGGGAVTDAVREAYQVANIGRALAGQGPIHPKKGDRFHFEAPGSVQGFRAEEDPGGKGRLRLENSTGHTQAGNHSLALHYDLASPDSTLRAWTPTFILPEERNMTGYELLAAPTLYPGQDVHASLQASKSNAHPIACRLFVKYYGLQDQLNVARSRETVFAPGECNPLKWKLHLPPGATAFQVGLELSSPQPAQGTLFLDSLGWEGPPLVTFTRPVGGGAMWRRAWVEGVDSFWPRAQETFRLIQNRGRGLLMTGTRDWKDYCVSAPVIPHLARAAGIALRVQGLLRYYGLLLGKGGVLRLVRVCGEETLLGEARFPWEYWQTVLLRLQIGGQRLRAWADDRLFFDLIDPEGSLDSGGIGLVIEEGCMACDWVQVEAHRQTGNLFPGAGGL